MENENATKSIIYGNIFQNKYGKFMPICSSILDRTSITNILDYLKQSAHFKKFNRVAYAYRVDEMPVVFITEKKNIETQYYDGCYSDETIEGSGEKLLHLLEKFNIRNVLIAVLIQQFNPLFPFQCTNYRAIVQNSRLLLDQLYRKVIQFEEQNVQKNGNNLLLNQDKTLKINKVDVMADAEIPQLKKTLRKQRPNYVHSLSKPSFSAKKLKKPNLINQQQLQFLWERCRSMKEQYSKIIETLQDKQLEQMRYYVMYDKNQSVNIVIQMFMIFQGVTKQQIIEQFDFKAFKKQQLQMLSPERLKKLDQIVKTNKKLSLQVIIKINRALGMVFSLMEISIRYSNCLDRITSIINKNQKQNSTVRESSAVRIDTMLA